MSKKIILVMSLMFGLLLVACEKPMAPTFETVTEADTNTNTETNTETDTETDSNRPGINDPSGDICAAADFTVTRARVSLMLLVDMSASMDPHYQGDTDNPGYWSLVKPAIISLLSDNTDTNIDFGYNTFPFKTDTDLCEVRDTPILDVAPGNNQAIIDILPDDYAPTGGTPLWRAMFQYLDLSYAPGLMEAAMGNKYLVIISDGGDGCGIENGSTATNEKFTDLTSRLLESGIKTFTIGFGDGGGETMVDQLNAISAAGGTSFDEHLAASDQARLEEVFASLTSAMISCTFDVPKQDVEVNEDEVNFYFDDDVIPKDDNCAQNTGWRWTNAENTEVEFCMEACKTLQEGGKKVTAEWGCPSIIII